MKDEIYTIYTMDPNGVEGYIPCYTCGHCTSVVAMRTEDGGYRTRPRERCLKCGRLICEKNEICRPPNCIPMHRLADDKFEADEKWLRYVQPIMRGATTLAEAEKIISRKEN